MTTQQAALIGGSGREITFAQAINEALAEEMRRDPRVFIIGEDVAEAGTPFKVLSGLAAEFGTKRVILNSALRNCGWILAKYSRYTTELENRSSGS